jgi:biotin synthase-like enzyme
MSNQSFDKCKYCNKSIDFRKNEECNKMISQKEIIEQYLKFEEECNKQNLVQYTIIRWLFEVWLKERYK